MPLYQIDITLLTAKIQSAPSVGVKKTKNKMPKKDVAFCEGDRHATKK